MELTIVVKLPGCSTVIYSVDTLVSPVTVKVMPASVKVASGCVYVETCTNVEVSTIVDASNVDNWVTVEASRVTGSRVVV